MKIIATGERNMWGAQAKLIREYVKEHRADLHNLKGIPRLIARLRLEIAAWKYASRKIKMDGHGPHSLYHNC